MRAHLQGLTRLKPSSSADTMIKEITSSEDILFYWQICSADFEIEDGEVHDFVNSVSEYQTTGRSLR